MGIKSQNADQYGIADPKITPQVAAFGTGITSSTNLTSSMRTRSGNPKASAEGPISLKQSTHR